MLGFFEAITKRLAEAWRSGEPTSRGLAYRCQCERPVFFRNSLCLGCKSALGFEPELLQVRSIEPGLEPDTWRITGEESDKTYRRCGNFESPAGCNWLVPADDPEPLCRACRLNQTIPDLNDPDHARWWRQIENAKRRLVAQLLNLGLPVQSKVSEDTAQGVMFDFLRNPEKGPRVLTGHANGLITLNIEEADDARREKMRLDLREPYRTLLGHFRHEIGHYYWDRLIAGTPWHEKFRELFGDERQDYAAALKRNYEHGRRATGASGTSAPTPPSIPGRTGPNAGRITCTWSTASIRPSGLGSAERTSSRRPSRSRNPTCTTRRSTMRTG